MDNKPQVLLLKWLVTLTTRHVDECEEKRIETYTVNMMSLLSLASEGSLIKTREMHERRSHLP